MQHWISDQDQVNQGIRATAWKAKNRGNLNDQLLSLLLMVAVVTRTLRLRATGRYQGQRLVESLSVNQL
jgi:hypothetical protein